MKHRASGPLLATWLAATTMAAASDTGPTLLLGNWACRSGPCFDEEISFALEDGARVYSSWLHARPAAVDGRWTLAGDRLEIECCAGLSFRWRIVRIDDSTLVMREQSESEDTVLERLR